MPNEVDFYAVLGVGRDASSEEIQRAYRRLARRHHPDVSTDPDAEERFKQINEAYAVLSDPAQRARYDEYGDHFRDAPPRRPTGSTGRRVRVRTGGANPFDLSDWWFGSGGPWRGFGSWYRDGADAEAEIELTVEDAYTGGRRRVTVTGPDGTSTHEVTFPPGAVAGTRIRVPGLGAAGRGGGTDGDLYLVVCLAPHPRYRVADRDVTVDLPVAPWEAALGASVAIETPGGSAQIILPAGSSSGRRLRLRGRGLPNPDGPAGDLYAAVRIVVPEHLSAAERRIYQRLAQRSQFDARAGS